MAFYDFRNVSRIERRSLFLLYTYKLRVTTIYIFLYV